MGKRHWAVRLFIWISIPLLLFSCATNRDIFKSDNIHEQSPLSYSVKVESNFFYDSQEINNFHWLEYLYWTKRIYGDSSAAYMAALPEKNIFSQEAATDSILNEKYLRHPVFRNYPMVGLSREQIEEFSEWRADRVMEYLLIRGKYIERDTSQKGDNHFTIDRLLNGEIELKKPLESITHYPKFRLPTQEEWLKGVNYADSVFNQLSERQKLKQTRGLELNLPILVKADIGITEEDSLLASPRVAFPMKKSGYFPIKLRNNMIYRLKDNVAEFTNRDIFFGGESWCGPNLIMNPPSECVGFRHVMEWVEIESGFGSAQPPQPAEVSNN